MARRHGRSLSAAQVRFAPASGRDRLEHGLTMSIAAQSIVDRRRPARGPTSGFALASVPHSCRRRRRSPHQLSPKSRCHKIVVANAPSPRPGVALIAVPRPVFATLPAVRAHTFSSPNRVPTRGCRPRAGPNQVVAIYRDRSPHQFSGPRVDRPHTSCRRPEQVPTYVSPSRFDRLAQIVPGDRHSRSYESLRP